ncbi:MAG: D-2-hydroxyacid dehydrogenase [Pseudomonadota bacterium]
MSEQAGSNRVIIHAADPGPLADVVAKRHPGMEVVLCDSYQGLPDMLEAVRPDVVFTIRFAGTPSFPRDAVLGPYGPKWIAVGGSGVDHLGKWDPTRVTVTNSAGVAADMMAEFVMSAMLHFTHDFRGLDADRKARNWPARVMTPVRDKHLLILGLGKTGQALAKLAKAFGMTVTGIRANPGPTEAVDEVHPPSDLPRLWGSADYIAVCAPLLSSTRGLVDEASFAAMKPGAFLADVSRGGVVVEAALVQALRSGQLAGAALDVFETEPLPPDNPLWTFENVLVTPHCSSVFHDWELATINLFSDNLDRWLHGRPLFNVVDPDRGY